MNPLRLLAFLLLCTKAACPYSVLSHEALIDALWDVQLRSALLAQYPQATPEELKTAHGYAYGGAIIQDLGYYPHGSAQFSDLTHYVRTGDFILALLHDSQSLNELAFSLGALSHYVGDLDGHRYATNVSEPILYPRLRRKFGSVVTYEESPAYHLKTEYSFDVLEVAKGNFAPQAYHDFIGFYVANDLVSRAFRDTYGLELSDLFGNFNTAIDSYRSAVSRIIPTATRIAWAQKKDEIHQTQPSATRRRFVYIMKRSSYEKEWGKRLEEPSPLEKFLAFLLRLLPPIGPLADLKFKMPTPAVEDLFMQSFNRASLQYAGKLKSEQSKTLVLPDENYDVGAFTAPGAYALADDSQAFLLNKLASKHFTTVTPAIKAELLTFYRDLNAPFHTKHKPKEWKQVLSELAELKSLP
jgi:hypothetical protein